MFLLVLPHNLLILFNPSVATKIFYLIAELVIPMRTPSKKAKAEIEIYSVATEAKTRKVQYNLQLYKPFYGYYLSVHFALLLQRNNFCFIYNL